MRQNVCSRSYPVGMPADQQKSGGSPTKRKREADDEGDPAPSKGRHGAAPKPQQDFEKLITDAETDINVFPIRWPHLILETGEDHNHNQPCTIHACFCTRTHRSRT